MCVVLALLGLPVFSLLLGKEGQTQASQEEINQETSPVLQSLAKTSAISLPAYYESVYFEKLLSLSVTEAFAATEPLNATAAEAPTGTAEV